MHSFSERAGNNYLLPSAVVVGAVLYMALMEIPEGIEKQIPPTVPAHPLDTNIETVPIKSPLVEPFITPNDAEEIRTALEAGGYGIEQPQFENLIHSEISKTEISVFDESNKKISVTEAQGVLDALTKNKFIINLLNNPGELGKGIEVFVVDEGVIRVIGEVNGRLQNGEKLPTILSDLYKSGIPSEKKAFEVILKALDAQYTKYALVTDREVSALATFPYNRPPSSATH